jgi:outer membrane protein TolC
MNEKTDNNGADVTAGIGTVLVSIMLLLSFSTGHAADAAAPKLSLPEGLRIAAEENRVLKIAEFSRGMAEQDINTALSRYFPSVNATAGYTMLSTQPGMNTIFMPIRTSEKAYPAYGVSFHQTIFDFFARESMYRASKESLELTARDIFRTKNLVALEFVNAFFTLLEADKLLAVGQKEVKAIESHAEMAKNHYEAGAITKNDLLQAEVKLSDARQRLLTLKNSRAYHASVINRILTRPLNRKLLLAEPAGETPPLPPLKAVWESAINNRPEVRMADYEISINELKEDAKKAEFLPSFFAEGGYSYSRNRYMINDDNWSVVFGLKFNLFSGGATWAELSKLKIRTEQLREQRRRIADELKLEAERYYLDQKSAEENIAVTREAVRQATENLRINTVRYEEGAGTATDVLDAIALLTLAEKNHYRAAYDLKRAHAGLLYATGQDLMAAYK